MAKVSDKEFWGCLREAAGLYTRCARIIEKEYNISYTRVAVKLRAERDIDQLNDIREQNIDIAEEGLHSLMRSDLPSIRMRAIELFLKTIGRGRGYVEKKELEILLPITINEVEYVKDEDSKPSASSQK